MAPSALPAPIREDLAHEYLRLREADFPLADGLRIVGSVFTLAGRAPYARRFLCRVRDTLRRRGRDDGGHPIGAVVWALALFSVGLFFGFLFGHPRAAVGARAQPATPVTTLPAPTTPLPTLRPVSSSSATPRRALTIAPGLTPTGSLDEIAEWLTKMIVGVTLVELRQVPGLLGDLSVSIGNAVTGAGNSAPFHALAVGAILCFWTLGFLFGYLWLRLRLQTAIGQSDIDLARVQDDARAEGFQAASASLSAANPDLITDAADLQVALWDTDPNKGAFGGSAQAKNRELRAVLAPALPGHPELIAAIVELEVRSTDPVSAPLKDPVTFVLHPTFNRPEIEVTPENGVAHLRVHQAWGAFTVGVRADGGATQLELDLANVAGAPPGFYLA